MFWIDHVGVVARDLDESIAFYTKLFGDPIDQVACGSRSGRIGVAGASISRTPTGRISS